MSKNKRVILYVAICHTIISFLLFSVFITTYWHYFYEVQKFSLKRNSKSEEKLILNAVHDQYRQLDKDIRTEKKIFDSFLEKTAAEKMRIVKTALLALSDKMGIENPGPDNPAKDGNNKQRLQDILQPLKRRDFEKPFIDLFDEMTGSEDDNMVVIKRVGEGVPNLQIPIQYKQLQSENLQLSNGEHKFSWTITAYGVPKEEMGPGVFDIKDILSSNNLKSMGFVDRERLAVFSHDKQGPLFQGKENQVQWSQIQQSINKSLDQGTLFVQDDFETVQIRDGVSGQRLQILSILTNPELKLTFSLNRYIYEDEWRQFGFWSRAKVPILVYAFLAWIVCPILGYLAYRMALKFRFTLTLDLEEEREEFSLTGDPDLNTSTREVAMEPVQDQDRQGLPLPLVENEEPAPRPVEKAPAKTAFKSRVAIEKTQTAHPTEQSPFAQINPKDLLDIRENNIRKSNGTFNQRQESKEDVDYLEGVQSDVLKSLIRKLRAD